MTDARATRTIDFEKNGTIKMILNFESSNQTKTINNLFFMKWRHFLIKETKRRPDAITLRRSTVLVSVSSFYTIRIHIKKATRCLLTEKTCSTVSWKQVDKELRTRHTTHDTRQISQNFEPNGKPLLSDRGHLIG